MPEQKTAATVLDKSNNFTVFIQLLRLANVWETRSAESGAPGMDTGFKADVEPVAGTAVGTEDDGGDILRH